jgi:tetratricopeptide (TPR) repeat protein
VYSMTRQFNASRLRVSKNTQEKWQVGQTEVLACVLICTLFFAVSCRKSAPPAQSSETTAAGPTAAEKIGEADKLYSQREDLTKVRQAIALMRQARVIDYGNYDMAWKLAKYNYYLAAHTTDETEREDAFREGIEAGKQAVQLQQSKPEGHFWLGANYGGDAEHSTLAGLANVEDIKREMESVLKIDERYEGGSAYLGLGQLYLQAPRVLGGDTNKAIEYFEKGLKIDPNNSMMHLNLAQAYHSEHRDSEAQKHIDYIMKMTPDPDHQPEYKESLEKAKKLSQELAKK